CPVNQYQRDGAMAGMCPFHNGSSIQGGGANYYPNDRAASGDPAPVPAVAAPPMPVLEDAWIGVHSQATDDYHTQAGDLFRLMTENQKQQLTANVAGGLKQANASIQMRML